MADSPHAEMDYPDDPLADPEDVDLKLTLTLTFLQNPDEFDLEGKTRAEELAFLCSKMAENFEENTDDLIALLNDYAGSYSVKLELTPEGEV